MSEDTPGRHIRLADFLPYQLNVAAATVSEGLLALYGPEFGLDVPCWRVLATLAEHGAVTATFVGQSTRMHKTKVSRAVMTLETRGLLQRQSVSSDRRERLLRLTEAGEAMFRAIGPRALAYEDQVLAGFTAAERETLRRVLQRLAIRG